MNTLSRVAGLLGLALVASMLQVVVAAAPAEAQTQTWPSRVRLVAQSRSVYRYDESITIRGWVEVYSETNCPTASHWCTAPDTGNGYVRIDRRFSGSTTTSNIATRSNESDFTITTSSRGSAVYTVTYVGGQWTPEVSFASSAVGRLVAGSRHPHGKAIRHDGALWFVGTVTPDWGRRAVRIQKKSCRACAWRTYRDLRTNRNGYYYTRISAPRRGRWFWRSTVQPTEPRFVRAYSDTWSTFR